VRRQNGAKRAPAALGVAAVLTALSLLASACSRGSVSPSQTPDTVSGHLIWWDIAQQADSKAVAQELIDRFHTINPNVTVDLVELGFDDLKAKFDTAAQSASGAPDVITLDSTWVADFGARGYLARLDGTRADVGQDDIVASVVPTLKWDGRLVALPRNADADALLYNPSLLRAAGVPVPQTWTQVSAARLKLTARGVQTLYAPATGQGLLPWIYGDGGKLVDPDAKRILVNAPPAVRGLTDRVALQATDVSVGDATADSVVGMRAAFREGRVAMIIDNAAAMPGLAGGAAFNNTVDIGIAKIPEGSERSSSLLTAAVFGVYAASQQLPAAYEFIKYLSSAPTQDQLTRSLSLLPTRTSAYLMPDVQASDLARGFQPVIAAGTPLPQTPQSQALLAPLDDAFRRALAGDQSPQQALDDVAAAYRKTFPDYTSNLP